MKYLNFKPSDYNISGKPIPEHVADKIQKWHTLPMQRVRDVFQKPIWASQKSGYRSVSWEKAHGRSGASQHTFKGLGAVDWTCRNFATDHKRLLELIIKHTDYTRIAVYGSFIHCDYKKTKSSRRELYSSGFDSKWKFNKYI